MSEVAAAAAQSRQVGVPVDSEVTLTAPRNEVNSQRRRRSERWLGIEVKSLLLSLNDEPFEVRSQRQR